MRVCRYRLYAATRLSLGRIEEALEDCMKTISLDPNFLKVHLRAANSYLVLGDIENALLHFMRCSQSGPSCDYPDEKLVEEASEGLKTVKDTLWVMHDTMGLDWKILRATMECCFFR